MCKGHGPKGNRPTCEPKRMGGRASVAPTSSFIPQLKVGTKTKLPHELQLCRGGNRLWPATEAQLSPNIPDYVCIKPLSPNLTLVYFKTQPNSQIEAKYDEP